MSTKLFKKLRQGLVSMSLWGVLWALTGVAEASLVNPSRSEKVRQDTANDIRRKLEPLIGRYCADGCEIVSIDVSVEEAVPSVEDIGFEGVGNGDLDADFYATKAIVTMQVDDRIASTNRDKMQVIFLNHLRSIGLVPEIHWQPVRVPQNGRAASVEEQLKRNLEQKLTDAIGKVIETYCPEDCVLSHIGIDGKLISPDEAADVPEQRLLRDDSIGIVVRLDNIPIDVSVNEELGHEELQKIGNLIRARTRFVQPVNLDVHAIVFPESHNKKKAKENDPYGLEKLRETLKIFRELASTKEIITNNSSKEASISSSSEKKNDSSTVAKEEKSSAESKNSESSSTLSPKEWGMWIGGLILLMGLLGALIAKQMAKTKNDSRISVDSVPSAVGARPDQGAGMPGAGATPGVVMEGSPGFVSIGSTLQTPKTREEMALRLRCDALKDELVKIFLELPRVAKETFKRMLSEEGVEETGKYLAIFGQVVVFELLGDPNMQRDLYALSEFFHKSTFRFTLQEEYDLLLKLKTRCTATEIMVLSRKSMERFEFLSKLDAQQLYNLVADEKPQVQAIAITQLEPKKRMAVFSMYEGAARVALMQELSRADAIPKEFLFNVANILSAKVQRRPEFDAENLRSSEILIDLLEKSDLDSQRELMLTLQQNNPETARALKLKLVTIEMMPFLKTGHLLEIVMGMDRQDLLTFLVGTKDHIRNLMMSKAPQELAESWNEDLGSIASVDDNSYQLVELKILARIRNLASTGAISLLEINDLIFGKASAVAAQRMSGNTNAGQNYSRNAMVA